MKSSKIDIVMSLSAKEDHKQDEIVDFPFLDGDVSHSLPIVYTFCNLFILPEFVLVLRTSTTETNFDF